MNTTNTPKRPLRVFLDARPAPGGIQRSLSEMVRRMRQLPAEIELIVNPQELPDSPVLAQPTRRQPALPSRRSWTRSTLGNLKRVIDDQLLLPSRVRKTKADVFIAPGCLVPSSLPCPSIVQCHDLWIFDHPETKRKGLITSYERQALLRSLAQANRIVVPSRTVLSEMQDRFPQHAEKVRHIYLPLSTPIPKGQLGPVDTDLPTAPFFLSVGTIEPRKNLRRLVEAHESVWLQTQTTLYLVGPYGWREHELLRMVERAEGVHWLGPVDEPTLEELYRRATAVVQVSLCEGFNYPMVEAMQRRKPLVLSDLPVHREIAGDCADYCNPTSTASLAGALEKAAAINGNSEEDHRSKRRALSAHQRLLLLEDESYIEQWQDLLHEVSLRDQSRRR